MALGWLRTAALATAVALGVAAGSLAPLVLDDPGTPSAGQDPLGIGADLVNQGCTGESILIVGRGESRPALRAAVVENPGEARYLETAASCPTRYAPLSVPPPKYAVYLGPFESRAAACRLRMTAEHRSDAVTGLRSGNQTYVKCPCELSTADFPVLSPDMAPVDTLEALWIRQLQGMLVDLQRLQEETEETGQYDAATIAVVKRIQAFESLTPTGVVDQLTWDIIRDRACRGYDY